jgi:hypothetical protein
MTELPVTRDDLQQWLDQAASAIEFINSPLRLTLDGTFTLVLRPSSDIARELVPHVCYDNYCEAVQTVEDIEEVIERSCNQ